MASEKLNQAFIKAYGKRNLSSSPSGQMAKKEQLRQSELSSQPEDSLIVRFDTATVQSSVPQMHNQRPPRQLMAMAPTAGNPQAPATAQSPAAQSSAAQSTAAQSSAPPFSPAAALEPTSEPIDSLSDQNDFLGTHLGSLVSSDDWSSLFGSSTMIVPQANWGRPSEIPTDRKPSAMASTEIRLEPEAVIPTKPIESKPTESKPTESKPIEAETIQSVRSAAIKYSLNSSNQQSVSAEPTIVEQHNIEQHIAARNRDGEILRLDRPSQPISSVDTNPQGKSDTQRDAEAQRDAETRRDIESQGSAERTESAEREATESKSAPLELARPESDFDGQPSLSDAQPRKQKVFAAEEGLRRARKRIFNPLWEVDRLDWPRVCLELMAAIEDKSPGVARNLSNACEDGLQVLAVTSPLSGAGTSTVACCLAMLAGRHGLNVALVDGNLENPSLCYQTNLEIELDWHEAIAKRLPLEEVAVNSVNDQITMVPLLARLSAPQLNEHSIATVLQELSQSFDLVIVDLGPMATSKNMVSSLGSSGILNAVVTVVDRRQPGTSNIESCLRQIRMSGISSIGLVENFAA